MTVEMRIEQGRLARALNARGGIAERILARRTRRVADIARREAPGRMGSYIDWKVQPGARGLEGVIVCDHPATLFVLYGTRPHIIRPRRAKALRFDAGGRTVFAAVVHHPGTRPNDFLGRALRAGR
ncbi:hypothetical protein HUT18_11525 [Streptomyces sp. NA04227]|uniref:hypothetical protein n=1 Tax=Streptomyces sp. NA04227 TaxID=2742136 RepID=UPI0015904A0E|nr:hypothetical protein [Streptomyces sp. NA04227]QKW06929.1 hypothetical protein HUT18_11525 [Streptomyces sp. NA04227]